MRRDSSSGKRWRYLFMSRNSLRIQLPMIAAAASWFLTGLVAQPAFDARANYVKRELFIPMRDGVKLFTIVYAPRDTTRRYPLLMTRTAYGIAPYGANEYRT